MTGIFFRVFSQRLFERCRSHGKANLASKKPAGKPNGLVFAILIIVLTMHVVPQKAFAGLALIDSQSFVQHLDPEDLTPAHMLTISPDGRHLYATSDRSLAVYRRDADTGAISLVELEREANSNGRHQVISADGRHLYRGGVSTIEVFSRDDATGQLGLVEVMRDGTGGMNLLSGIQSLAMSPDDRNLYVYALGVVAVLARDSATGSLSFVELLKNGVNGVEGLNGDALAHVQAVTVSGDGRNVYAAGKSDNAVAVFSRDSTTGVLKFLEAHKNGVNGIEGLKGVESVTTSPDGRNLYAAGHFERENGTVAVFSRDGETGALKFLEVLKNGMNGVDGFLGVQSVTVSPDGANLYVGVDDRSYGGRAFDYEPPAIVVFSRDSATGVLFFEEVHKNRANGVDGLIGIESLIVSPDGRNLYTAGPAQPEDVLSDFPRDGALVVFARDVSTGILSLDAEIKEESRLSDVDCFTISPDGRNLYIKGPGDNVLSVFLRDKTIGALSYLERQRETASTASQASTSFGRWR